jgi:nucleotide-binding universal stress UspA family protein
MNHSTHAIVVGIGVDGAPAAVTFAIQEARRTGSPVHLVHVLHHTAAEVYAGAYDAVLRAAEAAIGQATATAQELVGDADITVTSERVEHGWLVSDLVQRADRGRMVVLEHRRLGRLQRLVTGSTVNGVAGSATVPVVSVPADWTPAEARGVVTAAVQDADEAGPLLRAAFEQARLRRAALVVVHAWWLASGFDVVVVDEQMRAEWRTRARAELAPAMARLQAEYPDVPVEIQVPHAPPAEALLTAAERSDLLVIGRRHHRLALGGHLGPVARAVLDRSGCPVLMTPRVATAAEMEAPDPAVLEGAEA